MSLLPLVAAGLTAALSMGFGLPFGKERLYKTTYAGLSGLKTTLSSLARPSAPSSPVETAKSPEPAKAPDPAANKPSQGSAVRQTAAQPRRPRLRPAAREALVLVSTSTVPQPDRDGLAGSSPLEGTLEPMPKPSHAKLADSPEAVREAYEADASKFPLDADRDVGGVALRLVGLCRVQDKYIIKAAVSNRGDSDFFVKELAVYAGEDAVPQKPYVRLFVEPGRTVEGHVVFSPPSGAQVKIKLKEDKEKGRVLEVPVRYPF